MDFHGAKYGLRGPFSSRLRSRHGTDRQTRLVVLESGLGLESGLKSIFAGLGLGLGL